MALIMKKLVIPAVFAVFALRFASAETPSFSNDVELVNVNVTVRTPAHGFVHDLAPDDFVVLENGVPQHIASFAQSDVPVSVALLLDSSGSMARNLEDLKRAARRLVSSLRPQDTIEVVAFDRHPIVLQDYTTDRSAVESALDRVRAEGDTALHTVLYVTLKDLASSTIDERRRRAIVLFSDGEDNVSMVSDDTVLAEARRAGIGIYSVLLERPAAANTEDSRRARYFLSALARESGGEAFFPEQATALNSAFSRIADALRSQYNLGYIPSDPSGRSWRQILVAVRRRDVDVRHRLGYYPNP
jgi:VWFA-related protein